MLSLWSARNPNVWVTPGTSQKGTYIRPGILVDKNTVWNSQTSFCALTTVEATSQLRYTYPEFNELNNPDAVRNAIGHIVNQLYGTKNFSSLMRLAVNSASEEGYKKEQGSSLSGIPAESHHVPTAQVPEGSMLAKGHGGEYPIPHQQPSVTPNIGIWEWVANVVFEHNELQRSFGVLFFLGNVPEDPTDWMISSNFIGGSYAYVARPTVPTVPTSADHGRLQVGCVLLNYGIIEHSRLTSLDPNVVEPYLTRSLQWRVQMMDRTVADLESLEVTVIATQLTQPPGAMFPVQGEIHRFNGITHGKHGGSRRA